MARAPSKAALRRQLRARRAALSDSEQALAAQRIAAHVGATRWFMAARRIACYLPNDGEIDPSLILERIWRTRKHAFLPVLPRPARDRLWFAPAVPGMELARNRYGIPEPRVRARELLSADALDLVLLPLVAFDIRGNRLGRGAGFYDRSLAFLRLREHLRKPRLLGLAHDFQRVDALTADSWDVRLDGIVTDQAVYYADS